jgi:hypothetical protein
MTRVYLFGDENPVWITEPADLFAGRVESASPDHLLAVNLILWTPEEDDNEYEEGTGYVRADQVTFIAPLWPTVRERVEDARHA